MAKRKFTTELTLNFNEGKVDIPISVLYDFYPGLPPELEHGGGVIVPAEAPSVEIFTVSTEDENITSLLADAGAIPFLESEILEEILQ